MNYKKSFVVFLALMLIPAFLMTIVSAAGETSAGVNQKITSPEWFVKWVNFFGLGSTWAEVIVAIAVLIMIFAAAYGILEYTAFENKWVKYLIAISIAVVTSVTRGIALLSGLLMAFTGGSVVIATFVAIVVAIVFFIVAGFFKGKMKAYKYKQKAQEAEGAMDLAKATLVGDIKRAKAAAKAASGP